MVFHTLSVTTPRVIVGLKSGKKRAGWRSFSVKFEASRGARAFPFTAIVNPPSLSIVQRNFILKKVYTHAYCFEMYLRIGPFECDLV